jgi:hypothetical protein
MEAAAKVHYLRAHSNRLMSAGCGNLCFLIFMRLQMSVQVGTDVKSVIALRVPNRNITSCTSQTPTALR